VRDDRHRRGSIRGDTLVATWSTYDAQGKPWWLIALLSKSADGS